MEPRRSHSQTSMSHVGASIDEGLRQHFVKVYNIMAMGLVITGLSAWFTTQSPALTGFLIEARSSTLTSLLIAFSPMLIIAFAFNPATMRRLSSGALTGIFLGFSAYFGWLLSLLFLVYTAESITNVFFITSATFLAMSIWGQTTRKDLTSLGSFLMMGVIGLFIAIIANFFMQSSQLQFIISGAGVLIYTLMIAYDTKMIKATYSESYGSETNAKLAVQGALSLYINFIMLFQFLIQLLGQRE